MKQPKKEKVDKMVLSWGSGMVFKAKIIGMESVPEPRGDIMCQEAIIRQKFNVRIAGAHKRKIQLCLSLQGIKIKDEKTGVMLHHHPVHLISFISQDITDARAFGYVFGSAGESHQFIAIKTEKPAFHVVLALRDLFQTVLNHKQVAIDSVKEQKKEEKTLKEETWAKASHDIDKPSAHEPATPNIYFEPKPILTELTEGPTTTIDNLLDLEIEMHNLKEGINSMDSSIAAAAAFNSEVPLPEMDPFDTSFVLGPKRDSFPMPMPVPVSTPSNDDTTIVNPDNKYAVFKAIDASAPSIFETNQDGTREEDVDKSRTEDMVIGGKSNSAPKPARSSKDLSVFADLDPLGKDRPYKDKTEFFQDVKNPPKKVLNDLVDPVKSFDATAFPVDFESASSPASGSSSGNPFDTTANGTSSKLATSSATRPQSSQPSAPIPIPSSRSGGSLSNGSPHSTPSPRNGVSRPRPRPVSNRSSHSLSSSDPDAMQSIAHMLGSRLRAQSLSIETKKSDPFADDPFFLSLPKKNLNTEIPEYA